MTIKPKASLRFLKALINFLAIVLFGLVFDAVCASKIAKQTPVYQQSYNAYYALKTEYNALEDYYGLYYYDESGKRIKNEQADTTAFYNDPRTKEIIVEAKGYQRTFKRIDLITFLISYIISAFLITLIPPIFSKKNYDIGGRPFNIVVSKNDDFTTKKEYYKLALLYICFHYIIGIMTLLLLNLCDFLFIFSKKFQNRSLMEKVFKYDLAIDFDKVESEILTDEKKFENEHSHSDKSPRDIIKF